jgi:ATP-dependent Clp protease ATP-binding subunit ClpC
VFSRYELIDRVLEARRTAQRLRDRLEAGRAQGGKVSRELVARLALQLHLVQLGIEDVFSETTDDVLLTIEPVSGGEPVGAALDDWCAKLRAMYRCWAQARHMRIREIGDAKLPSLIVAGFGAMRILCEEAGLHVWETKDGVRLTARVRVCAAPEASDGVYSLAKLDAALAKSEEVSAVVRRYRKEPDPLVRDARKGWRSGKLDAVLSGAFDLIGMLGD